MEEKKDKAPINFVKIAKKLWPHRKKYYYVLPATLIATYLLTLCIPRYYKCTVSLAPEIQGASISGSLGSFASSIGLGSSLAKMASQDAIYSEIYPDVIKSNKFIAELMVVDIKTQKGDVLCNYYTYLRDHQKAPWWTIAREKITNLFKEAKPDTYNGKEILSTFNMSELQTNILGLVQGNIRCSVDKKTDIVSITVTDQDPLVCATIADATCKKLQEFITAYRTNKARIDYDYYHKLCEESKKTYEKSVRDYTSFADANRNAVLVKYTTKESNLENEMQANYNLYTTMKTQMQVAQAKLQEATPAFTVIQSASVPIKPAGPKRMIISIAMMILSFIVLSGWLLLKNK